MASIRLHCHNNNNDNNNNNNNTDDGMVMLRVICFGKYTKRWVFVKAEKWYSQKPKGILESESHKDL